MSERIPDPIAIVFDGDTRAALAVVRSLGRRGVRVRVASHRVPSLAGSSERPRVELGQGAAP